MRQLTLPDLVKMANENNAFMNGSMKPVHELLERHEVVIGIWEDPLQPQGIGTKIIKGLEVVELAANSAEEFPCRVTAIKCLAEDQARGLALVFGNRIH